MSAMPDVVLPNDPALLGQHIYAQVASFNPARDPADPVKMSAGLDITIHAVPLAPSGGSIPGQGTSFGTTSADDPRLWAQAYGADSGLKAWLAAPACLGGAIQVKFAFK